MDPRRDSFPCEQARRVLSLARHHREIQRGKSEKETTMPDPDISMIDDSECLLPACKEPCVAGSVYCWLHAKFGAYFPPEAS
jgi:hypothetical protein